MDKSWIPKSRWSPEYIKGVQNFLEFASQSQNVSGKILCPCKVCINRYFHAIKDVKDHLMSKGFFIGYVIWIRHGEEYSAISKDIGTSHSTTNFEQLTVQSDQPINDDIEGLLRDTFHSHNVEITVEDDCENPSTDPSPDASKDSKLLEDMEAELYPGCKSFSKLSFILHLFLIKCLHSWTARSFDMLLELLNEAFPDGVLLLKTTYEVKKIMRAFDLGYENEKVFLKIMGPEHPRRVWTQGFGVTPTRYFPHSSNTIGEGSGGSSFARVAKLEEEMSTLRAEMKIVLERL